MIKGKFYLSEMDIDKIDLGWKYNEEAIHLKGTKREISILREAVSKGVETPYTYDRLSILLVKKGEIKEAIKVCEAYKKVFEMIGYKPSIIKRLERLKEKI